ncbi:MAG: UDP-N-acetylmuramoyl-L-alanine--D-glutamate ligase [Dehalococcoidia bacterium]|nr:UDP-N-acetylmuramoyl-L-alanine--D-glutamate ligase [Dehalococcoidia bacterium]
MRPEAPDVRGQRALVYSLGMEGRDLAAWLLAAGAEVVMSDTRSERQLAATGAAAPPGVTRTVVGQPLLDPAGFDLVAVSQSVLRSDRAVRRARELGIPLLSQMQLFLQLCPGRVVGITGSSGKSTTTALVGEMARVAGIDHVVGGNIGAALLGRLTEIGPATTVILEISHTQLQYTDRSPAIAAITNVTPNHLDQFTWDEYVGLKRAILLRQRLEDVAVLNVADATSRTLVPDVRGRLLRASLECAPAGDGAWLSGNAVRLRLHGHEREVVDRADIHLRGRHNLANVVMACAVAGAAGIGDAAMARGVRGFRGVPHRLEVVGSAVGATWINDSIATSPERTVAGLNAFAEPVVLLLGGREKNLPLEGLREAVRQRCRAVVCFGEAAELFRTAIGGAVGVTRTVGSLTDAVATAATLVQPGDVVLMAPAGTSFDAYPHFEARGEAFRTLVRALPGFREEVASEPPHARALGPRAGRTTHCWR